VILGAYGWKIRLRGTCSSSSTLVLCVGRRMDLIPLQWPSLISARRQRRLLVIEVRRVSRLGRARVTSVCLRFVRGWKSIRRGWAHGRFLRGLHVLAVDVRRATASKEGQELAPFLLGLWRTIHLRRTRSGRLLGLFHVRHVLCSSRTSTACAAPFPSNFQDAHFGSPSRGSLLYYFLRSFGGRLFLGLGRSSRRKRDQQVVFLGRIGRFTRFGGMGI
jgi:hypothetical protein